MARVTVEDCLKHVKNRFELVVVASKRARQIMRGKETRVPEDNDKPTVIALREIAAGYTNFDIVTKDEEHAQHPAHLFSEISSTSHSHAEETHQQPTQNNDVRE